MSQLDILPQLFPCTRKFWTTSSEPYLQSFANNLPNIFTNGVIYLSVLSCQKEWRYHFQNHSTPNKRGRSMVTRILAKKKYGHKKDSFLQACVKKQRINYPKPMDVYHPKDLHCVHIFQALSHWNSLTLSIWEVTWSGLIFSQAILVIKNQSNKVYNVDITPS